MKASELRIGNFVHAFGAKQEFFRIDELIDADAYDYIEPIPITEEWLLKFGFAMLKNSSPQKWYKPNCTFFEFNKWKSMTGIKMIRCNRLGCADYVHQLQNLYFALTGEELELK